MEALLALVIVALVIGALVLPWIQRGEIDTLKSDLAKLRTQVAQLREQVGKLAAGAAPAVDAPVLTAPAAAVAAPTVEPAPIEPEAATAVEPVLQEEAEAVKLDLVSAPPTIEEAAAPIAQSALQDAVERVIAARAEQGPSPADEPPPTAAPATPATPPPKVRPAISWEQQIGARLPVWIGGIALALSGIFLVKYSIDAGLLDPLVRCALAGAMGIAMLAGAQFVAARKSIDNGARISQALAGAGIAVLYGALFAAGSVYDFISPGLTFAAMGAVTALAVLLSLRHGQAIALLGMVGGFLTPALISSSQPNAAVLFTYLTALTIGLFAVARREKWWWIIWPTLAAAFSWVVLWLLGNGAPGDGVWLGLFLIAIGGTAFSFAGPHASERTGMPFDVTLGLILTAVVAVLLMCVVLARSKFGAVEWGLYGVLAAGSIWLSIKEQERYRYLPWVTMAASAVMFAVWVTPDTEFYTLVLLLFTLLYAVSGLWMMWRAKDPVDWGGLSCASALIFYLIAYGRLSEVTDFARIAAPDTIIGSWPVWGIAAAIFAVIAALVTGRIVERRGAAGEATQQLLAQYSLTATAFLALGLSIEFERPALAIAIAGQTLAVAWVNTRVEIKVLRWAAGGLGALFVWLMLPQLLPVVDYMIRGTLGWSNEGRTAVVLALRPLMHLGVPALLFGAAGYFLLRQRDDHMARAFECGTVVLAGMMGYFVIRHAHAPAAEVFSAPGSPLEGGFISQVLIVYAIALAALGRQVGRDVLVACGVAAAALGIARVVHFDIQPAQLIGAWLPMAIGRVSTIVTSLPISETPIYFLGLPASLLTLFRMTLGLKRDDRLVRVGEYVAAALVGLMGYFLIRHAFVPAGEALTAQGSSFEGGVISQAQIVYAVVLALAARFYGRMSLVHAGVVAAGMAAVRIVAFDMQPLLLIKVAMQMSLGVAVDPSLTLPIASSPLFHLALPAALLAGFGFVLSQWRGAKVAPYFDFAAMGFAGFAVYYLTRHAFNSPDEVFAASGTYLERGVLTNVLLVFGLALYASGQRLGRLQLSAGGAIVAAIVVARIAFFDVLTSSPLAVAHDVGTLPVVNALLLPYGLTMVWLAMFGRALTERGYLAPVAYVNAALLLFLFFWISLNVRQVFQGPTLNAPTATDAEVYVYSAAWLVLGVGLLVAGAARKERVVRFASLAVMLLTVGKVFLYDAAALEGLWRVVSFLGLGLSLIGLSWFYTRYVFVRDAVKAG